MAEVSYEIPLDLPDASALLEAARRLLGIPDTATRNEAVMAVFKLVDNVLTAPEDWKKRRIKKTHDVFHRKVGQHSAALDFLRACGFKDSNEGGEPAEGGAVLAMPVAYLSRLTDARHTLAKVATEAGIVPPVLPGSRGFNPYVSNSQHTDSARTLRDSKTWRAEADSLREEVQRREGELKATVEEAPPVELQPTAFWLSAGRRLEEVVRAAQQQEPDRGSDNALLKDQVAAVKAAVSGTSCKFQSADKKRLAELSRLRAHPTCVMRVICPDKSVLQVHLRAAETGARVTELLGPLLAPHIREASWYLYQSPPLRRLSPKETLMAAGLTPGANVYLGFNESRPGPPYMQDLLLSQLGPPPGQASSGAAHIGGVTNHQ